MFKKKIVRALATDSRLGWSARSQLTASSNQAGLPDWPYFKLVGRKIFGLAGWLF